MSKNTPDTKNVSGLQFSIASPDEIRNSRLEWRHQCLGGCQLRLRFCQLLGKIPAQLLGALKAHMGAPANAARAAVNAVPARRLYRRTYRSRARTRPHARRSRATAGATSAARHATRRWKLFRPSAACAPLPSPAWIVTAMPCACA